MPGPAAAVIGKVLVTAVPVGLQALQTRKRNKILEEAARRSSSSRIQPPGMNLTLVAGIVLAAYFMK